MWKFIVGFIAFAALTLWVLSKSGGDVDLGGEKHDVGAGQSQGTSAGPAASAAAVPASAASR